MDTSYKKRPGTSGISGQLYETKLISLLLFRLLHDNDVEDFHLASNMDEVGAFDDICVKVKIKGQKPVILFIQVKHKDNDDKFVAFDNNNDLVKWSDSIIKVKQKLCSAKSCDIIFGSEHTECLFILYTNAKYGADLNDQFQSDVAINVNRLLATKATFGSRPLCNEKFVQNLSNRIFIEEISILTERLIKYLCGKANQSMNILNDEYILRYHVILTMKVFKVSEIQYDEANPEIKWRQLTFQSDFFSTNDKNLLLFKAYLFEKLFNYAKTKKKAAIDENTSRDLSTPETMMAELMWPFFTEVSLNNKKELLKQLSEVNLEQDWQSLLTIDKEKEMVATTILSSLKIKVPIAFGNLDLSIRGNAKKIESRIKHLTNIIIDLCQKAKQENDIKFITILDTTDEGLLSPNGGLGGIIGNVLVNDEETKSYKFINTGTSLKNNAKTLYLNLQKKLINLQEFRFKVEAFKLPRLSFDYTETAKDFLSNIIVYANQGNHYEIEEILKKEIEVHNNTNCHNVSMHTDSVFLYYHNEIQKWWMSQKTGLYLTKSCDLYQHSMNNIVIEPHMSGLQNMFHLNKMKNNSYTFTENAMDSLHSLQNIPMTVIVTDITTLTTVKVIQYLKNKNTREYAILDLQSILNINLEHFTAFTTELRNTQKISIIVCDNIQDNKNLHRRLDCILGALQEKHTIIIVHNTFVEVIKEYCPRDDDYIHENHSLANLTLESQIHIIKNVQIILQGQNTRLDLFLNEQFINCINGTVLDKIIRNETLIIGETLSNSSYENIRHFYIERRVNLASDNAYNTRNDIEYEVKSFFDLADDTVLLTAKPGMGKSTLLTHLSLETKKIDPTLWIVRINLLDHSKDFFKWQENGIAFNRLDILKFFCKIVLRKNNLQVTLREENNTVYLDSCTAEEWTTFELKFFLHLYNQRKVILLFDGFDEICPHYKDCVIQFLIMTKDLTQRNKMWVTSRPYSEILPGLKKVLGKCYEIGYLDDFEQEKYLKKLWNVKLVFNDLNKFQMKNAITLMIFIRNTKETMPFTDALSYKFYRIVRIFYNYLYLHMWNMYTATKFQLLPNYIYLYSPLSAIINVNGEESQLQHQNSDTDTLLGTPLLLYLIAHYFVDLICVSEKFDSRTCINTHAIYTMFVEMKLKTILFQDKNKMDIYNPSIMTKYEKERRECWDMHKKIAAYVLLGSPIFNGLNFSELKDMDPLNEGGLTKFNAIVNSIKSGTEKTGLISHVTADNIPVFIHRTFAEYFAAEFICDIFKSATFEFGDKRVLFTTTSVCHLNDVLPWITKKRELDSELHKVLREIENSLPIFSTWHHGWFRQLLAGGNWSLEQYIRLMNSTPEDFKNDTFILNCEYSDYLCTLNHSETKENIIAKMKPHLKKYFITSANELQPKTLGFNLKSAYTRFKKHLLKRKSSKLK